MSTTTVKISKSTLIELEKLREELKTSSLDQTIKTLIQRHKSKVLSEIFGVDKERIKPFSEEDRGEDR